MLAANTEAPAVELKLLAYLTALLPLWALTSTLVQIPAARACQLSPSHSPPPFVSSRLCLANPPPMSPLLPPATTATGGLRFAEGQP